MAKKKSAAARKTAPSKSKNPAVAKSSPVLKRLRSICLSLPDTTETLTWGKPHFRVADKIFCGFGEENGKECIGFKLEKRHAAIMVRDPQYSPASYVGKHGWVSMDATMDIDWVELESFILESYRLIAPKKSLEKL